MADIKPSLPFHPPINLSYAHAGLSGAKFSSPRVLVEDPSVALEEETADLFVPPSPALKNLLHHYDRLSPENRSLYLKHSDGLSIPDRLWLIQNLTR